MDSRSSIVAALLMTLAAACSVPERGSTERFTASGEMIALSGGDAGAANACLTCHGVDGLGDGGGVPRLAGLSAGYLDAQLGAYADGRRYHERMAWISSQLTESERIAVSRYYSALPYEPQPAPPRAALALYTMGDAERGMPSCASCHGLDGGGIGAGNPPLGGQPALYLAAQLHAWRDSKRRSDPNNVMLNVSQRLTPAEVTALSAYAAALPGRPDDRLFREASR